jgi:hypothetical protein
MRVLLECVSPQHQEHAKLVAFVLGWTTSRCVYCLADFGEMHMDLSIEGEGGAAAKEIADLREWIHEARLREVQDVKQEKRPPKPGEQGPELLQALQVVLAAPAVIALVACIRAYIIARRPKMKIKVKTKSGTLEIDATNPPSPEELQQMAKTLAPS